MSFTEQLKEIVLRTTLSHLTPADITTETDLVETCLMDELDLVEIAMELEEMFDMEIPDSKMINVRTISDLAKCTGIPGIVVKLDL